MDCSTPGFPVLHHLPELAQTHVHWVCDAINHLIFCHSLLLPSVFPCIRVFSSELRLHIRCFNLSISPSSEYSGLIFFRIDCLISLLPKGFSRVFFSTTIWKHQFFGAQPSSWSSSLIHMTTRRTIAYTTWTFVGKVMSLFFNSLSGFVIAFLPRSKHLLISRLQSPSTLLFSCLRKSVTVSIASPSVCHEVIRLDAMILVFWILSFKPGFSFSSFTFIKRLFSNNLNRDVMRIQWLIFEIKGTNQLSTITYLMQTFCKY